jgi:putative transcriptional regulator
MVTCRLPVLLAERRMNRVELAKNAKVSINTLRPLFKDIWKGVQRNTVDAICKALDVQVGDLFLYVGTEERKAKETKPKKGGK